MTEIKKRRKSQDAGADAGLQEVILFVVESERRRESKSNKSNKAALWPSPEDQIQFYQDTH